MVGWAGGSALGSQELYSVRTSPSLELKVQGQEICGEGRAGELPPCSLPFVVPLTVTRRWLDTLTVLG